MHVCLSIQTLPSSISTSSLVSLARTVLTSSMWGRLKQTLLRLSSRNVLCKDVRGSRLEVQS